MFCPQCGQQASDEIRFCPRCGLPLTPHAAILAGHESAPATHGAPQLPAQTRRRISTRRAAKLMFFSVALFPLFLLFSIAADAGEPMIVPFILFFIALAWWAYARLFIDDTAYVAQRQSREGLKAGKESPALGASQFVPASLFNQQRANTAEIARPPSVTEHTTKLLDKDS